MLTGCPLDKNMKPKTERFDERSARVCSNSLGNVGGAVLVTLLLISSGANGDLGGVFKA